MNSKANPRDEAILVQKSEIRTNTAGKRKRTKTVKAQSDSEELPHALGKRRRRATANDGQTIGDDSKGKGPKPKAPVQKPVVKTPYGVTLGKTPFPDHPHPTPEDCQMVEDILTKSHRKYRWPDVLPAPDPNNAGCVEVWNVVEALMRTICSANTSMEKANGMVDSIIARYHLLENQWIDWEGVRLTGPSELETVIKAGGMASMKSKQMCKILTMVRDENDALRAAFVEGAESSTKTLVAELDYSPAVLELARKMLEDPKVLTLDYLHVAEPHLAWEKFIKYPGMGLKTASCVLLFCLQAPYFAVDTHVHRLCVWLGWVPPSTREYRTFGHCDTRVPDELKYSIHQLLIDHGKTCGRCASGADKGTPGWEDGCVIEHLVNRIPIRKENDSKAKRAETGVEKAEPKAEKPMTAAKAAKMAKQAAERRAKREKATADGIDMYAERGHQRK